MQKEVQNSKIWTNMTHNKFSFYLNFSSTFSDLLKSPYASQASLRDATSEVFSNNRNNKNTWSPCPPKSRRPISAPVYKNG